MQLLAAAQKKDLPDLDLYITTDDWPQKQQVNVSQSCPVQGPVFAQVLFLLAMSTQQVIALAQFCMFSNSWSTQNQRSDKQTWHMRS